MNHLIIGRGEIGSALMENLLGNNGGDVVYAYDDKINATTFEEYYETLPDISFLHICIPDSRHFAQNVNLYIKTVRPKLTIVHSTVEVGKTRQLAGKRVHSPVRGQHPDIEKGLKTFVKYIGADNTDTTKLALRALENMRCRVVYPIESSELAKLLSLSRYGLFISFARYQEEICKKYGVTYSEVVIDWEVSYNEGLMLMDRLQYTRPLITPPKGKIGGHCVIPAMEKIAKDSDIIQFVLDKEKKFTEMNTIYHDVRLSSDCVIGKNVKIGKGSSVWHFVNILEGANIGENCIIGSYVEIGKNIKIGNNCKIEAHAFIPEGVTIEDNVFVGPGVIFTNDKYPRAAKNWELKKTRIKQGASIGAGSVILCGLAIGKDSMVGAGSTVTKNVPDYEVWLGNPAEFYLQISKKVISAQNVEGNPKAGDNQCSHSTMNTS